MLLQDLAKMVVSDKYKFVFIEIPKTASTSISHGLCRSFGRDNLTFYKDSRNRHCTLEYALQIFPKIDGYKKFCFVRNHWDIAVSFYLFEKKMGIHELTFDKWVVEWYIHQMRWIKPKMDFIGRYENLQKDFNLICNSLGGKLVELKKLNDSLGRKHYSYYYNKSTKLSLQSNCSLDIAQLKYFF